MNTFAQRIAEPEHMTPLEEQHYARADYSKPHEELVEQLLALVGPQPRAAVADLGCGPGDILLRLRRRGVAWDLYGLDLSEGMLASARRAEARLGAGRPIQWRQADIKDTGLPKGRFDVLISNSVLHHLGSAVEFWREVGRLGKPGAVVLVRDLRRPDDERAALAILARHVSHLSAVVREHYLSSLHSSYTVEEVRGHLRASGLVGLSVRPVEDRYLEVVGCLHQIGKEMHPCKSGT
jgi:2-polyprenyl-3-methyl-5-hydroxy-6-metoxy-1,4-benzoquinol methylase